MTDISPAARAAREDSRTRTGQFGEQARTAPEGGLSDTRTSLPVIVTARLAQKAPVAYPASLPPGGVVDADLEDTGGIYVSITFPDQFDEHGEPIRISLGGDDEWSSWNSIGNGDVTGFANDIINDDVLNYLSDLHTHIVTDAETVRFAATTPHLGAFVARATGSEPAEDYSDEASIRRGEDRGGMLVGAFADPGNDLDDDAADAIADILLFAKSRQLDVDELLRRARNYADED